MTRRIYGSTESWVGGIFSNIKKTLKSVSLSDCAITLVALLLIASPIVTSISFTSGVAAESTSSISGDIDDYQINIKTVNDNESDGGIFETKNRIDSITLEIYDQNGEPVSGLSPRLEYVISEYGEFTAEETDPGTYKFTLEDGSLGVATTTYQKYDLILSSGENRSILIPVDHDGSGGESALPGPIQGWQPYYSTTVFVDNKKYTAVAMQKYPHQDGGPPTWLIFHNGELVTDKSSVRKAAQTAMVNHMTKGASEKSLEEFLAEDYPSNMRKIVKYDIIAQFARAVRDGSAQALGTIAATYAGGTTTVGGKAVSSISSKEAAKLAAKEVAKSTAETVASQYSEAKFEKNPAKAFNVALRETARSEMLTAADQAERAGETLKNHPDDAAWSYEDARVVWVSYNESMYKGALWSEVRVRTMPQGDLDEQLTAIGTNFAEGATGAPVTDFADLLQSGQAGEGFRKAINATADSRRNLQERYQSFAVLSPRLTEEVESTYGTNADNIQTNSDPGKASISATEWPSGDKRVGETATAKVQVTNEGDSPRRFFVGYSTRTQTQSGPAYYDNDDQTGHYVTINPGATVTTEVEWVVQSGIPLNQSYDAIVAVWDTFPNKDAKRLDGAVKNDAFQVVKGGDVTIEQISAPSTAPVDNQVMIGVTLKNSAPTTLRRNLALDVDGKTKISTIGTAGPNKETTVPLYYTFTSTGNKEITVAGRSTTINIRNISVTSPNPSDGQTGVSNNELSWDGPDGVEYSVKLEKGDQTPDEVVASSLDKESYTTSNLEAGATYYWQVTSKSDNGTEESAVWSFTTAESDATLSAPSNPTPEDGASGRTSDVTLSWSGSDKNSVTYDVYFGSSSDQSLYTSTSSTSTTVSGLESGETYNWKVVADDGQTTATGGQWSFSTADSDASVTISDFSTTNEYMDGPLEIHGGSYSRLDKGYLEYEVDSSDDGADYDIRVVDSERGILLGAAEHDAYDDQSDTVTLEMDEGAVFREPGTHEIDVIAHSYPSNDRYQVTTTVDIGVNDDEGEVTVLPANPVEGEIISFDASHIEEDSGGNDIEGYDWRIIKNPDGDAEIVKEESGENKDTIEFTPNEAAEYDYSVSNSNGYVIDDAEFYVEDGRLDPSLETNDFSVPDTATSGQDFSPSIDLKNTGDAQANYLVRFKVDGEIVETEYHEADVDDEDTESISLSLQAGTYEITAETIGSHNNKETKSQTITVEENSKPDSPESPTPAVDQQSVSQNTTLSWAANDPNNDALTHTVRLEKGDSTPETVVGDDLSDTSFSPDELEGNTTYYWQVSVTDEHGATTSGPVWKFTTVRPNTPPEAELVYKETEQNQSVTGTFNGSDSDSDLLSYKVATDPSHGQVTIDEESFTYTPDSGYDGSDSFEYRVSDGNGGNATAPVSVMINETGGNVPPTANGLSISTIENESVSETFNGTDSDGDNLEYSVASSPDHGKISIEGDSFTYTPDDGYAGSDSFTYKVSDGNGGTDVATVSMEIDPSLSVDIDQLEAPHKSQRGYAIKVTATINNTDKQTGVATIDYRFNGTTSSDVVNSTKVELSPRETREVVLSYEVPESQALGTVDHGVFTDDDGQTTTVEIVESAYISVQQLEAPNTVQQGKEVPVNVTLENTRETDSGKQTVEARLGNNTSGTKGADYEVVGQKTVQLDSGQSRTVKLDVTVPSDQPTAEQEIAVVTEDEAERRIINITSAPAPADYANQNGTIETTGLRNAIDDWRAGNIQTGLLRDVIDYWRSGESVPGSGTDDDDEQQEEQNSSQALVESYEFYETGGLPPKWTTIQSGGGTTGIVNNGLVSPAVRDGSQMLAVSWNGDGSQDIIVRGPHRYRE